jgi:hypothetical protein
MFDDSGLDLASIIYQRFPEQNPLFPFVLKLECPSFCQLIYVPETDFCVYKGSFNQPREFSSTSFSYHIYFQFGGWSRKLLY